MIVINKNAFKKLEEFREHLHLDDSLKASQFLKMGVDWFLIYTGAEILLRLSLWKYGFMNVFFDEIFWLPRIMFLILLARRFNRLLPQKTISALAVFTGIWGFFLGLSVGIEKLVLFRDLANLFVIPAEFLSLFVLGGAMGYLVYHPPLALLYKHQIKTNE